MKKNFNMNQKKLDKNRETMETMTAKVKFFNFRIRPLLIVTIEKSLKA